MRLFLAGKGGGAALVLQQIAADRSKMPAVFTTDPALQQLAQSLGLWWTAQSINLVHMWPFEPQMIVSCGSLDIMTPRVIGRVHGMAINCHYALLPHHRGRSSVPWAILAGDTATGVTWHWIEATIDTGKILLQAACTISQDETQTTLFGKLDELAGETYRPAMTLAMGMYEGWEQRGYSTYHKAGPPHGGVIDPGWGDDYVYRFIRAMTHPPLPYARLGGVEVRSWEEYEQMRRRMAPKESEWLTT